MRILIKALGELDIQFLETVRKNTKQIFGCPVDLLDNSQIPGGIYNEQRGQYDASLLLPSLKEHGLSEHTKLLGIVNVDIYIPELNYVFGLADISSDKAIISLARLRQEFYGLPCNELLFLDRTIKEAVHELGHIFGLQHCNNANCVMYFSNSLHDTDVKSRNFCENCKPKLIN